jgi:hypothetical protein
MVKKELHRLVLSQLINNAEKILIFPSGDRALPASNITLTHCLQVWTYLFYSYMIQASVEHGLFYGWFLRIKKNRELQLWENQIWSCS